MWSVMAGVPRCRFQWGKRGQSTVYDMSQHGCAKERGQRLNPHLCVPTISARLWGRRAGSPSGAGATDQGQALHLHFQSWCTTFLYHVSVS